MHTPVLKKQVIECLNPGPDQNFIDCTAGQGGHSLEVLKKNGPGGKVLAIDRSPEMIKNLKKLKQKRLIPVCENFANLKKIVKKQKFEPVSGILIDLGTSMWHIKQSGKGFSFQKKEPLIMRYDGDSKKLTAMEIINTWPEKQIVRVLKEYGQERFAEQICKKIVEQRKVRAIINTDELVNVIRQSVPAWYQKRKIHAATKTFQALRIAVNQELENLEKVLPQALNILEKQGRMAVISFHSLEDKIVKDFLRKKSEEKKVQLLNKKVIKPSQSEMKRNPSSRSAKLRVGIKI